MYVVGCLLLLGGYYIWDDKMVLQTIVATVFHKKGRKMQIVQEPHPCKEELSQGATLWIVQD
jgi:hypothetical protein